MSPPDFWLLDAFVVSDNETTPTGIVPVGAVCFIAVGRVFQEYFRPVRKDNDFLHQQFYHGFRFEFDRLFQIFFYFNNVNKNVFMYTEETITKQKSKIP